MGCDIHAHIEYKSGINDKWYWFASVSLRRDYQLFSVMASVRGECAYSRPPKGVPRDISWNIADKYLLFIVDDDATPEEGCVTPMQAERWIQLGHSVKWDDNHITDPDAHTGSWLDVAEMDAVLSDLKKLQVEAAKEYDYSAWLSLEAGEELKNDRLRRELNLIATADAMKRLSSFGDEVRLVFWFDN